MQCSSYSCQGFLYKDHYGCRLYFSSWEEAQAVNSLTYFSSECHDHGGGQISQTFGASDFYCYVVDNGAVNPRMIRRLLDNTPPADTPVQFVKKASGYECSNNDAESDLGDAASLQECAQKCDSAVGCSSFIYGHGDKAGRCWNEGISFEDCTAWEEDDYDFYKISNSDSHEAFVMTKAGHECNDNDNEVYLGLVETVEACYDRCTQLAGCKSFIYGYGGKAKQCWSEGVGITRDTCSTWDLDSYNFYEINDAAAVEVVAPFPSLPDAGNSGGSSGTFYEDPLADGPPGQSSGTSVGGLPDVHSHGPTDDTSSRRKM